MGEIGGFLKVHRVGFDKRDPRERVRDYKQYFRLQDEEELRRQGGRCMDCGVTTSPSSPGSSAPRRASRPACWTSTTTR
jgi:hypothetical protein